ncbi:hypothetical protein IF1G_09528 [Cordyceps javanica]|uniref:Uncharacterized protein n=1 Tax=Cordyceps javanica TaxID=43265 RepID=A0A545VQ72_9HYPO|nr:hypothetical protein IF1G_09528 [Cordyceps javanica]TQW03888.1 hypothetical protein IF2G_08717 [Cordyceps javanica]
MEPTRHQKHGHDDFHDSLIPGSWWRESNEETSCATYDQAPSGDGLYYSHRDQLNNEEGEDEEGGTLGALGTKKLPFRSRSYDLVPDETEFTDPLASPSPAPSSDAFLYDGNLVRTGVSDRRDFGAQPSPFSTEDTERLITQREAKPKLWTPKLLTRLSLLLFAAVFVLLLLVTGLVYHLSLRSQGLATANGTAHYVARCIPTALFVLVAACWRQVDSCIKTLTPWSEMAKFPAAAERSILVDYITPVLPLALYRALNNRHWAVVMSSLVYMLLVGTMLFSTGLFMLEDAVVSETRHDFKLKSKFELASGADSNNIWNVGPGAAQLYNAINFQGLRYPPGTAEDAIIPQLQIPQHNLGNTNFSVPVDAMTFDLDCERLPITNATKKTIPWKSMLAEYFVTDVNATDCTVNGVTLAGGPDHYRYNDKNATQNYQAQFEVYPCNTGWDFTKAQTKAADDKAAKVSDPLAGHRIFLSVTDIEISPYDNSLNAPSYMYIKNITALLCKPTYSIKPAVASQPSLVDGAARFESNTGPGSNHLAGRAMKGQSGYVEGIPDGAVALAVHASSSNMFLGTGGKDFVLSEMVPTFFQFMTMKAKQDSIGAFMDAELLNASARTVYQGMVAQTMHLLARQPAESTTAGSIEYHGQKLVVYLVSVACVCALLGLCAINAVVLAFIAPRAATPHRPGSIASMATVMAASPLFGQVISGTGKTGSYGLQQKLAEFRYKSVVTANPASFRLEAVRQMQTEAIRHNRKAYSNSAWWKPTGCHWSFICVVVAVSLAMIGALEGVQRLSDDKHGFLSVGRSSATIFITFLPAAVSLGIASMYATFATVAAVFAPFTALSRGNATATRTLHFTVVGRSLPVTLVRSVKAKHFGVAILAAANLVALCLPIVVSSLYSVVELDRPEDMTIHRIDNFKLDNAKLAMQDNHAASVDSLIRYAGLEYSQWTWNGLAFPRYEQTDVPADQLLGDAPLIAKVQAVRPGLTCSAVPTTDRIVTQVENKQSPNSYVKLPYQNEYWTPIPGHITVGFNTTMRFSDYCESPPAKNTSQASWMQYFSVPNDTSSAYIGKGSVLVWDGEHIYGDGAINTHFSSHASVNFEVEDHGCPGFAVTFGTIKTVQSGHDGDASSWKFQHDLATVVCYQTFEEVTAEVAWQVPDFALDPSRLPRVDESSARRLKSSTGSERFQIPVNAWLEGLADPVYNRTIPAPDDGTSASNDVDELIDALVLGKDGIPVDDIVGEANVAHLGDAVTRAYRDYMAQAVSLNMRAAEEATAKRAASIVGTRRVPGHRRLVQHAGPKIALQVMLGVMVLCLAVARVLLLRGLGHLLPHNPCTVAGMAALLADSSLATAKVVPAGSEWLGDEGQQSARLFAGWAFALRWWDDGEKTTAGRRYGIGTETDLS